MTAVLVVSIISTAILAFFFGMYVGFVMCEKNDKKVADEAFELGEEAGFANGHFVGFKAGQQQASRSTGSFLQGLVGSAKNPALANQHDGRPSRKRRFSPKPMRRGE